MLLIAEVANERCDSAAQQRHLVQLKKLRGPQAASSGLAEVTQDPRETCVLLA